MKYLRRRMVTTVIYIDDTILLDPSADKLQYNMHLTISTLEQAGFLLNYEKSILEPCTKIKRKWDSIFQLVNHILTNPNKPITIRHLGKIIGKIVATFPCSESAPLHYHILDHFKVKQLQWHKNKWSTKIKLNSQCLQELQWWKDNIYTNNLLHSLHEIETTVNVYSDTCGISFGGHWVNVQFHHDSHKNSLLSLSIQKNFWQFITPFPALQLNCLANMCSCTQTTL